MKENIIVMSMDMKDPRVSIKKMEMGKVGHYGKVFKMIWEFPSSIVNFFFLIDYEIF